MKKSRIVMHAALVVALACIGIALAVLAVRYDVSHIFHTRIPLIAELVLGVVLCEALPLVTLVVWVLVICGVLV